MWFLDKNGGESLTEDGMFRPGFTRPLAGVHRAQPASAGEVSV